MPRQKKSFLRTSHGAGKGIAPRVEISPPDELSAPVPVAAVPETVERRSDGTFVGSEAAKELGRKGGLAKAAKLRMVDSLGLPDSTKKTELEPFLSAADVFVQLHLEELAKLAGGRVPLSAKTMVYSAGLQLAASRFCFNRGAQLGDPTLLKHGSILADASRQNLLAAYETAVRIAHAADGSNGGEPVKVEIIMTNSPLGDAKDMGDPKFD